MSNHYYKQFPLTKHTRLIMITGKIVLSAAGAVLSNTIDHAVSVTKSGTGEYTLVFTDAFVQSRSVQVTHEGTAPDDVKVKADTIATNKTLVLNTVVSGAVANVATACTLHVLILVKDSTVAS